MTEKSILINNRIPIRHFDLGLAFLKMIDLLKKKNMNKLKNLTEFSVKPDLDDKKKIQKTQNLSLF